MTNSTFVALFLGAGKCARKKDIYAYLMTPQMYNFVLKIITNNERSNITNAELSSESLMSM